MRTVALIPIKMNSERLPKKNIKEFKNGNPLITYILDTLLNVNKIDDIYVYCSSDDIVQYLPTGVKFIKRDTYYDLNTTKFNEVLTSFAKIVDADTYILTHATAPFISAESITKGIVAVNELGYDSAFSVKKIQEFLWEEGKPLNYSLDNIPRTQDIKPIFAETCGLYVYPKNLILEEERRIGNNPYLVEVSQIEATDINEDIDFVVADAIHTLLYSEYK